MNSLENEFKERMRKIAEQNDYQEYSEAFKQKKGISEESIRRNIEKKTNK